MLFNKSIEVFDDISGIARYMEGDQDLIEEEV